MIKVILSGCGGRMGKAVAAAVGNEARIVAGVDVNVASIAASDFPIYESITEFSGKADVIVDFSHHSALPSLLDYAKATKTPVVVATTGHTDEELALMKEAAKSVAIFHSGNFSIGINLIINLAKQLSTRQKQMDSLRIIPSFRPADWREDRDKQLEILRTQTLPILGPIALCCVLTVKFSNSTTLIIAASSLAMMFLSRVHKSDLGKIVLLGLLVGGLALAIYGSEGSRSGTAVSRISSWSPDVLSKSVGVGSDGKEYYKRGESEHDQTLYAKMSIATGGLFGKGAGQSTNRYLAEADKDMAYAFLIEEYGLFFGGLVMLFAFLVMFYRSMVIFLKCGTAFPGLLVLGIGTVIVLQAFLHMLVSVSLFPLTGQQLPIVSKGGTSLVLSLTMLGVLMGVSAKVDE